MGPVSGLGVLEKKLIFAHARIRTPYRQVYSLFTIVKKAPIIFLGATLILSSHPPVFELLHGLTQISSIR